MSKHAGYFNRIAIPDKFLSHIIGFVNKQDARVRGIENHPTMKKVSGRYKKLMVWCRMDESRITDSQRYSEPSITR